MSDSLTVPLRSLCHDYKKDIVDGPFGANLKREHYKTEGVPVLKIQNIKPFKITLKKMDFVSEAKYQELKRHSYRAGDIVMTKLGNPLGESAIVSGIDDGLIVADLVRIRAGKIDTKYLCYHLNSPVTQAFINEQQKGTTRPRVRISVVRDLPIYAPPIDEQKRIVAILDQAFADIDKARANAEQNLKNARELFDSYLQQVFTQRGEGWVKRSMSDTNLLRMIDGDRGQNYPKKSDFSDTGHCLFLSTKNVRPEGFKFDDLVYISKDRDELLRKGKLERNDVIITTRGTIGNLALYDETVGHEHVRINSGMLILRPNTSQIRPSYLFEVMRSGIVKKQIQERTSGAAQPQLPVGTLNTFQFPVPESLLEPDEIVASLKCHQEKCVALTNIYSQKIELLDELKKSILQKAFSGELTSKNSSEQAA